MDLYEVSSLGLGYVEIKESALLASGEVDYEFESR